MIKSLLVISILFSNGLLTDNIEISPPAKIAKNNFSKGKKITSVMNKIVVTQPLTLQIWENNPKRIAPGTPPGAEIPVGVASLSFTLENKTQQSIEIKLLAVEVRSVHDQKPLLSMPDKQSLTLHPLEIAPQRYQLSNKNGYGNINQVEAVVIYELDGKKYTLKSSIVNILN